MFHYCCEVGETRQNRFPNDARVEFTSYVCDSHCEVPSMRLHMMGALSARHVTFIDVMIFWSLKYLEFFVMCLSWRPNGLHRSTRWSLILIPRWPKRVRFLVVHETAADVPESWVWWRANFQIGLIALKEAFWTFSYISMTYNVISCRKVAENTQIR